MRSVVLACELLSARGPSHAENPSESKANGVSLREASNTIDRSVPRGLLSGSLLTLKGLRGKKEVLFSGLPENTVP